MQRAALFAGFALVATLAACGGGGSSSGTPFTGTPATTAPTTAPTTSPTTAPTTAATNPPSMPQTATVGSTMVLVGQNGHTLYVFGADTSGVSNCTASNGCTGVWPPYAAPAGTTVPAGTSFTIITRGDGTLQWANSGAPLYEYSGDSASGQDNGNGITSFGGTWSTALPAAATSGPTAPPITYIHSRNPR